MIEDAAHLLVAPLAIAAAHEYLRTRGQAHAEHKHGRIKQTAESRCPQRYFTILVATKKSRIRHPQQLIHQHTDKDGISQFPNMSVGDIIRHWLQRYK